MGLAEETGRGQKNGRKYEWIETSYIRCHMHVQMPQWNPFLYVN